MRLVAVNDEYQCPKCFKFFDGPDDHDKCKSDKRPSTPKKSLNTIDADPDMYGRADQ